MLAVRRGWGVEMSDQTRVRALLDELQAAESAGAAALGGWIACCQDPVLRGGLRVVRARDVAHARLALERLEELGGSRSAAVAPGLDALCGLLGASGSSDRVKLGILLARIPQRGGDPFDGVLGTIEADDETRALLDGLRDDDRLSLDWLHAIGHAPPVVPRERLGAAEHANVVAFLGALHAALAGATEVTVAWAHASPLAGLRGGLRAIAARAAAHATLAGERLHDVGGHPQGGLPARTLATATAWYGADDVGDEQKLTTLLAAPGSARAPAAAIDAFVATLAEDVETREILRLVAAGEAATMAWLGAYREAARVPLRVGSASQATIVS